MEGSLPGVYPQVVLSTGLSPGLCFRHNAKVSGLPSARILAMPRQPDSNDAQVSLPVFGCLNKADTTLALLLLASQSSVAFPEGT